MDSQTAEQLLFDVVTDRPVVVKPSKAEISSDGGLIPIREFDRRWNFTKRMVECLTDWRIRPGHSLIEMLRQRLYGILADYEDCNDHDDLRNDPIFRIVARGKFSDIPLASQPTLSRFENGIRPRMLMNLKAFLVTTGIERLKGKHEGALPAEVTLDIDPTDVETHGQQQLTMFHGYYDQHQYFPQIITEPTTQHVFMAQLRHGSMHPSKGADESLMEVVDGLRDERSDISIHVRADSGFSTPAMYELCENNGFSYIFGLTSNKRLKALAEPLMHRAVDQFEATGQKQRLFTVFDYQADSWKQPRTVIAKAEASRCGTNLRFVITNLWVASDIHSEVRYDDYTQRGLSEHRNDELKNGLSADRLSCHRFMANFWRLLLHTCAYNLLNALRDSDEIPSELRTAQPARWRSRLIKAAAMVTASTRRIVVEISSTWPFWSLYQKIAGRVLLNPRPP